MKSKQSLIPILFLRLPPKMNVNKQKGFSLIELMVAMMIGIFLIFAVVSSYSGSKASSTMRAELGEMESNARIAMSFLRGGIEHAGYPSSYVHIIEKPFLTARDGNIKGFVCGTDNDGNNYESLQEASFINNNDRYTKDGGATSEAVQPDRITISYMPDNPQDDKAVYWKDCAGTYTEADIAARCSADPIVGQGALAIVYNSYFVDDAELKCTSSRNITIPIASGIENIQFRYGLKNADGSIQYQKADIVEQNDDWKKVISVHVAMLVRSVNEVKTTAESRSFLLLDEAVTTQEDRYLRKVYTSLIHLPNKDR